MPAHGRPRCQGLSGSAIRHTLDLSTRPAALPKSGPQNCLQAATSGSVGSISTPCTVYRQEEAACIAKPSPFSLLSNREYSLPYCKQWQREHKVCFASVAGIFAALVQKAVDRANFGQAGQPVPRLRMKKRVSTYHQPCDICRFASPLYLESFAPAFEYTARHRAVPNCFQQAATCIAPSFQTAVQV